MNLWVKIVSVIFLHSISDTTPRDVTGDVQSLSCKRFRAHAALQHFVVSNELDFCVRFTNYCQSMDAIHCFIPICMRLYGSQQQSTSTATKIIAMFCKKLRWFVIWANKHVEVVVIIKCTRKIRIECVRQKKKSCFLFELHVAIASCLPFANVMLWSIFYHQPSPEPE